jgi:hypothetical protein
VRPTTIAVCVCVCVCAMCTLLDAQLCAQVGETWTKTAQAHILAPPRTAAVDIDALVVEKNRAFDLLDALTVRASVRVCVASDARVQRSGALPLEFCTMHIMLASTQVRVMCRDVASMTESTCVGVRKQSHADSDS